MRKSNSVIIVFVAYSIVWHISLFLVPEWVVLRHYNLVTVALVIPALFTAVYYRS